MRSYLAIGLVALLPSLVGGCANQHPVDTAVRPGSGVQEYRQLTTNATAAVQRVLLCLDRVGRQTNGCPSKLRAAFTEEVERLQVGSIRVRARAQAIQARGDAYLDAWSRNLAPAESPAIRPAAERMPDIEKSFAKIKLASREAGDAFRLFLSGLRKLGVGLETNANLLGTSEATDLINTTREHGQRVVRHLAFIEGELQVLAPLLTSAKSTAKL